MKLLYITLLVLFVSCNTNIVKEYHENKRLKKEYTKVNGKLHGIYKEYYESGNLKSLYQYEYGLYKDSSLLFYDDKKQSLKFKELFLTNGHDSLYYYHPNGQLDAKGIVNKKDIRIGDWYFYREDGSMLQKLEYFDIAGQEYMNQRWRYTKDNKLMLSEGNFYELQTTFKDTVFVGQEVKLLFHLKRPLFALNSRSFIILPVIREEFNKEFSNLKEIEHDTIFSLGEQGLHKNYDATNFSVAFSYVYSEPGIESIRGVLVEQIHQGMLPDKRIKSWLFTEKDTFDRKERKIYFDKKIYVKENKKIDPKPLLKKEKERL